jgi:hypothetical protein
VEFEAKDSVSKGSTGASDDGSESFMVQRTEANPEVSGSDTPGEEENAETTGGKNKPDGEKEEETGDEPGDGAPKGEEEHPEGETPEDETDLDEEDKKLPKGVQKKIGKLTRIRRDLERERETLREENRTLREAQAAPKDEDIGEEPNPEDFETQAAYVKALTAYEVKKATAADRKERATREATERKEAGERAAQKQFEETKRKLAAGSKKYKDFDKVVFVDSLPVNSEMTDIIGRFENIADVAYYLGKHPDECREIAGSATADKAIALKEISDNLKAAERKHTKAPKPIQPLATTGGSLKDLASMSFPEYCKARDAQEKERRGH